MTRSLIALPLAALLCLAGCETNGDATARTYEREQVGEVQRVEEGTIVSLTPVEIEGNESRLGTVIGAIAGGLAGRQIGSGTGRDVATVAGAVAGGYAGREIGENVTQAEGAEIGLEMDDGRQITVVQELDEDDMFRVGERVTVVFEGNEAHVEDGGTGPDTWR